MSYSDFLENELLDHILGGGGGAAWTPPATVYIALFTVAPNDAGSGGTEVSGGSYARTAGTFATAASGGSKSNSAAVTFPTASGSWGTVVAFGVYDAASGGNLLMSNNLTASKAVASGDTAQFAIGTLTATLD